MENATTWIDIPVIQALDYFSGVMAAFYNWASRYAVLIGTIGLCWSAFKLINSKFTVKEFWWNTFYKWLAFILLMNIYPLATFGISSLANKLGIQAGNGKTAIIDSLTTMKRNIEADVQQGIQLENDMNAELRNIMANTENITFETTFGNCDTYDEFMNKLYNEVDLATFNSRAAKKKALEVINNYRDKNKYHSIFSKKTLRAIKEILVQKNPDGQDGKTLVNEYVNLNIWLKDKNNRDTAYLSPSAIMRVTVLGCQILWEKNQISLAMDIDEMDTDSGNNVFKKGLNRISAAFSNIPNMLMTMFCCIVMVFCAIFACIQYLMAILEYTIITGIGTMFIPFILFDGTKELPKKLVPVFMGFFIKIVVINICLFYVFYLFIQETVDIMAESGGMNWVTIVTVIFSCIIAFILTQNAPKIAQTIMTGQPQMSMGEFLAAAGTLAMGTFKGGKIAGKVATEGTRKVAQTAVDTKGSLSKAKSAMETAGNAVAQAGGNSRQQNHAAMKGLYASISGDLKDKFRNAGNNFLHGTSSGTGGGSGKGIGPQAHQRSGQNTNPNIASGDSRTINTTSNPKFQAATIYDSGTQSNINMTRKQFYEEKKQQGEDIGNEVLKKMDEKKKKDQ